jgi:hypothetical protein
MLLKCSLLYLIILAKFGLIKNNDNDSILDRHNKIMETRSFNYKNKTNNNIITNNTNEQIINNLNQ